MSATTDRDNVISLARSDPQAAHRRAREISDPWFRCQALAWVARLAPEDRLCRKAASESTEAAFEAVDPAASIGAAAWPVRAMIERGMNREAEVALRRAISAAERLENSRARAQALFLLWQAAHPLGQKKTAGLLGLLTKTCRGSGDWQRQRILEDAALMVAADDAALAHRVVEAMKDGQYQRQAERRLAEGARRAPRPFFW